MMYLGISIILLSCWSVHNRGTNKALIELKRGNFDKALSICDMHSRISVDDPIPSTLAARACIELRRFPQAIEYATEAISRGGDFVELSYMLAQANFNLRKFNECLKEIDAVIAVGAYNHRVGILRTSALIGLFRFDDAMQELNNEVLKIDAEHNSALLRACVLNAKNQHSEAFQECMRVFNTLPNDLKVIGLPVRAKIFGSLGKFDEALEDANRMIAIRPDWRDFHITKAFYLGRTGQLKNAFHVLDEAANHPIIVETGYLESNRARLHLLENHLKEALTASEEAIKFAPDHPHILATHAVILLRNGQKEAARECLNRAIQRDPFLAEAYWFRGELEELSGNIAAAQKDKDVANRFAYIPYL